MRDLKRYEHFAMSIARVLVRFFLAYLLSRAATSVSVSVIHRNGIEPAGVVLVIVIVINLAVFLGAVYLLSRFAREWLASWKGLAILWTISLAFWAFNYFLLPSLLFRS